jgi:signal transduction histidine kinase
MWWISIQNRVTQRNMRFFLLAEHSIMLFWITVRFLQDGLFYHDVYISRVSGYGAAIPFVLLPLFGLYASFGLGKAEEYRFSRKWYLLLIPAVVIITLMLTNEIHQFVFRRLENETLPNYYYHPNTGIYILYAFAFSLLFVRIFLVYFRSRKLESPRISRFLPFLVAVFMLLFNIPYIISSYIISYELIEHAVFLFFMEILIWECCIIVGMTPVNTRYGEVFDRSTVTMQIVNEDGHSYLKSACAPELPVETVEQLRQQKVVRTPDGQEFHIHAIHGGYSIWRNDVSRTVAVIEDLQQSMKQLELDGELLRQELKARSDEAAVREQNRIYNQLSDEVGDQLLLLRNLLSKREWAADKYELFRKICLVGAYIKRRCNLRLVELSDGNIPNNELALCYSELVGCLRQMGVEANVHWNTAEALAPEFAIFTLDMFEFLLEQESFELRSIWAAYETEADFSIWVQPGNATAPGNPGNDLQRVNRDKYSVKWHRSEDGYRVSVCGRRV